MQTTPSLLLHCFRFATIAAMGTLLWLPGCTDSASDHDPERMQAEHFSAPSSDATAADTRMGVAETDDSAATATMDGFFFRPDAEPALEECCTNVGKMDECWWEDAIADGITCIKDSDCPWAVSGACVKDGASGSSLGVCKCRPGVATDCYDPSAGREGVCITDPADPSSGESLCGPSFCNGYLKCSCFGGCEWWDQSDPTNTPAKMAQAQSATSPEEVFCCEGSYPWGGSDIVTFYGLGGCDPEETVECVNDSECDDGNPCTIDTCNGSNECISAFLADGSVCPGVDTDATDCYTGFSCQGGFCQPAPSPVATSCGAGPDPVAGDCIRGFECDGSGNCIEAHEASSTPCDVDTNLYDPMCWGGYCGDVDDTLWFPTFSTSHDDGICWIIQKNAPGNDTCAGATQLGTGTISNTFTGVVDAVTGSTDCAVNDYAAGNTSCKESDGSTQMGSGANDVVYYFDYLPTDASQQDLYAFVITVESDLDTSISADDFHAVVYTSSDACDAAGSNPCLYQPDDSGGGNPPPVPWEYRANEAGRDWHQESQRCISGEYEWCERSYGAGTWTYPDSPTPCVFSSSGSYDCSSSAGNVAQTVVFPRSDQSGTAQRVYVFVDGAGSSSGTFKLTLERLLWHNGACERVTDAPRVVDITEISASGEGIYQGNLEGYANSDHSAATTDCGGYDCTATWGGWTSAHGGSSGDTNAFWPNAAYFKIQPSSDTVYCLKTDQSSISGGIAPVIEVRQLVESGDNAKDLCQGTTIQEDVGAGESGVDFVAQANRTYLVLVSEEGPNAASAGPCTADCNYKLSVTEGTCPVIPPVSTCTAPTTTYQAESINHTTGGSNGGPPAGWNIWSDGNINTDHNFTDENTIWVRAKGESGVRNDGVTIWPHMFVLIDNNPASILMDTYYVSNTGYQIFSATLPALSGFHNISVNFDNDTYSKISGDTNLLVDYIQVGCDVADTDSATDTDSDTGSDTTVDTGVDTDTGAASCATVVDVSSSGATVNVAHNGCITFTTSTSWVNALLIQVGAGTVSGANPLPFTWSWSEGASSGGGSETFTGIPDQKRLDPWTNTAPLTVQFSGALPQTVTIQVWISG